MKLSSSTLKILIIISLTDDIVTLIVKTVWSLIVTKILSEGINAYGGMFLKYLKNQGLFLLPEIAADSLTSYKDQPVNGNKDSLS